MNPSTRFRRPAVAATLVVLCLLVVTVLAAPGDLDTSFNSTGIVTTPIGIKLAPSFLSGDGENLYGLPNTLLIIMSPFPLNSIPLIW